MGLENAHIATSLISTAASTYEQYQAERSQAIYEQNVFEQNARLANLEAEDALKRGESEAIKLGRRVRRVQASQRAAFAGQGVEVDSGTPGEIQQETIAIGSADQVTIRNNAIREAYGFKQKALGFSTQARFASIAGRQRTRSTVLTGINRGIQTGIALRGSRNQPSKTPRFTPRNTTEQRFNRDFLQRTGRI